jgi:hypothetical protein
MSRLEDLPPDLSAVLSLLLRRGKRHGEVAQTLGIQERTVHDRAHAALALLAPRQARALTAAQREQIGEYLLGQQAPAAQHQSRAVLRESTAAHAWAQALAAELAPLSARPLAEIPAAPRSTAEPAGATAGATARAPGSHPPSSRVGGAVILGALGVAAVVVILLVLGVGGGGGGGSHAGTQTTSATSTAGGTGTHTSSETNTGTSSGAAASTNATSTGGAAASHGKALTLTPTDPATSKAIGVAYVLTQKSQRAFYVFAKGLPVPPSGSFYAVWLEGAATAPAYPLGSLPAANANGLVEGGGPLPTDASTYKRIAVTTETSHHPSHPGPTALRGAFSLG